MISRSHRYAGGEQKIITVSWMLCETVFLLYRKEKVKKEGDRCYRKNWNKKRE